MSRVYNDETTGKHHVIGPYPIFSPQTKTSLNQNTTVKNRFKLIWKHRLETLFILKYDYKLGNKNYLRNIAIMTT